MLGFFEGHELFEGGLGGRGVVVANALPGRDVDGAGVGVRVVAFAVGEGDVDLALGWFGLTVAGVDDLAEVAGEGFVGRGDFPAVAGDLGDGGLGFEEEDVVVALDLPVGEGETGGLELADQFFD